MPNNDPMTTDAMRDLMEGMPGGAQIVVENRSGNLCDIAGGYFLKLGGTYTLVLTMARRRN
jgi:hypothetical protein